MDFHFCGFDRVHARRAVRCYIAVKTDSLDDEAIRILARTQEGRNLNLWLTSSQTSHYVLERFNLSRDGSLTVYEYFVVGTHPRNRHLTQSWLYGQIRSTVKQLRLEKSRKTQMMPFVY